MYDSVLVGIRRREALVRQRPRAVRDVLHPQSAHLTRREPPVDRLACSEPEKRPAHWREHRDFPSRDVSIFRGHDLYLTADPRVLVVVLNERVQRNDPCRDGFGWNDDRALELRPQRRRRLQRHYADEV